MPGEIERLISAMDSEQLMDLMTAAGKRMDRIGREMSMANGCINTMKLYAFLKQASSASNELLRDPSLDGVHRNVLTKIEGELDRHTNTLLGMQ